MISNSVRHLRCYTNSAIANIAGNSAPISPVTPRDRRRRRAKCRRLRIERRRLRIERRRLRIERRYRRIESRLFHDVSQCFKCFMMFYNVLHNVLLCFMMFSESCNDWRRRIGARAAADRLRDRDIVAGIGDNSAEIGNGAAGIIDIAANMILC